jgi:bacterioferritin (cytochrome b1)
MSDERDRTTGQSTSAEEGAAQAKGGETSADAPHDEAVLEAAIASGGAARESSEAALEGDDASLAARADVDSWAAMHREPDAPERSTADDDASDLAWDRPPAHDEGASEASVVESQGDDAPADEERGAAVEREYDDRDDPNDGDDSDDRVVIASAREPDRYDRERLIDLLDERMMFERTAFDVYGLAIEALEQDGDPELARYLDAMRRAQNEEAEHAEWLERLIDQLGGAPGRTLLGRATETQTSGIVRAVERPRSSIAVLYAMLASEAADVAGWRLLLEIARRAGDAAAVPALSERVQREEEHYALVHDALLAATERHALLRPGGYLAGSGRR